MGKISLVLSGIFCILIPLAVFPPHSAATKGEVRKGNIVYLVEVKGEVDLGLAPFIRRVMEEADEEGVAAVILEVNTFGGRLDAAVQIRDALLNARSLTIAFVNERAISAGALISLSCTRLVMAQGATIGAATPVTIGPLDREAKPASEKVISYFRKEMKATAEKTGRPLLIAEAMVDPDVVIEGLSDKGKLLTLTTSEAVQHKVADYETSGRIQGVAALFHLQDAAMVKKTPNWAERFLRVTSNSLISSLLLTIGFLGLLIEFRTPTWGIAGTIGVICLILFFWGHWTLRLVGWEEILLLGIGIFLLILEAYIPGFGLPGILGIIIIAFAFTLSLVGRYPTASEILGAVSHIALVMCAILAIFLFSMKSLAKTRVAQRLVLQSRGEELPSLRPEQGTTAQSDRNAHRRGEEGLLGREGVAFTNLRPAGKGIFGEERMNVVTEGDFIESGSPIRVIRVKGATIVVQRVKGKGRE
ncbi:MAG: NfeD family protein [bacterium]